MSNSSKLYLPKMIVEDLKSLYLDGFKMIM